MVEYFTNPCIKWFSMQLLATHSISKAFGSFWANKEITIHLQGGEIISLLGENGAGKTTLMNILYGLYQPTEGSLSIKEESCTISCPKDAIDKGISMVHQHFMLVDSLSVLENIIIGKEPRKKILIDISSARLKVNNLSKMYGLGINVDAKVGSLSVGEKQRVELLKALYNDCDILILDEPTAVLTPEEVDTFFRILKKLKEAGKGIILISHKLRETMAVADRIYIMRTGEIVAETIPEKTSLSELATFMVGRAVDSSITRIECTRTESILALEHIKLVQEKKCVINDLSLTIQSSQILGIAGVDGNGQTELVELIMGLQRVSSGKILFHDQDITGLPVKERFKLGIGCIPEDRNKSGLVGPFNLMENLILGYQMDERFSQHGIIHWKMVNRYTKKVINDYNVRCLNESENVSALSGGNQQKLIIGRVLESDPKVIIAAQPTRGVDIGAVDYIHKRLIEMRNAGKGILLVSADLDEVMKLSDSIAVLYEGKIVSFAKNGTYDKFQLGFFMAGAGNAETKL